mmetsp:Transcript_29493/g.85838  ORF Transcript_29493/g.85838 Transcript_29493/m.85838 type:complete len:408 (-) Transcript_29493:1377-2600(-)
MASRYCPRGVVTLRTASIVACRVIGAASTSIIPSKAPPTPPLLTTIVSARGTSTTSSTGGPVLALRGQIVSLSAASEPESVVASILASESSPIIGASAAGSFSMVFGGSSPFGAVSTGSSSLSPISMPPTTSIVSLFSPKTISTGTVSSGRGSSLATPPTTSDAPSSGSSSLPVSLTIERNCDSAVRFRASETSATLSVPVSMTRASSSLPLELSSSSSVALPPGVVVLVATSANRRRKAHVFSGSNPETTFLRLRSTSVPNRFSTCFTTFAKKESLEALSLTLEESNSSMVNTRSRPRSEAASTAMITSKRNRNGGRDISLSVHLGLSMSADMEARVATMVFSRGDGFCSVAISVLEVSAAPGFPSSRRSLSTAASSLPKSESVATSPVGGSDLELAVVVAANAKS